MRLRRAMMYSLMAAAAPITGLAVGLKGYWSLDNTLADALGENPLLPDFTNYSFVDDTIYFPGVYPQGVATTSSIDLPFGNAPRTVNCWVKDYVASSIMTICGYGGDTTGGNYKLSILSNKVFLWGSSMNHQGNITLTPSAWNMLTVTYDGTNSSIFVNGVLDNTAAFAFNTSVSPFIVGYSNPFDNFKGYTKENGVWDRVLTQSEITQLYNNGNGLPYPFI